MRYRERRSFAWDSHDDVRNGWRHELMQFVALTIKGVYRTGYAVLGATVLSSLYLAFFI